MSIETINYLRATSAPSSNSSSPSSLSNSSSYSTLNHTTTTNNSRASNNNNSSSATASPQQTSSMSNSLRALILFVLGAVCSFVLNILQMEYKSNLFPHNVLIFLQTNWWALPICGIAAMYIGLVYPFFDHKFGQCHRNDREWTLIIRCVALFIGLNHLCAKITFANSSHFLVIFCTLCFLFWYWFDKTRIGLIFNISNALMVIFGVYILKYLGIISYSKIQFDYLQTCLLCLTFSGGITFGNIGRLLDFSDIHHHGTTSSRHLHAD